MVTRKALPILEVSPTPLPLALSLPVNGLPSFLVCRQTLTEVHVQPKAWHIADSILQYSTC